MMSATTKLATTKDATIRSQTICEAIKAAVSTIDEAACKISDKTDSIVEVEDSWEKVDISSYKDLEGTKELLEEEEEEEEEGKEEEEEEEDVKVIEEEREEIEKYKESEKVLSSMMEVEVQEKDAKVVEEEKEENEKYKEMKKADSSTMDVKMEEKGKETEEEEKESTDDDTAIEVLVQDETRSTSKINKEPTMIPILDVLEKQKPSHVAVPRKRAPISVPNLMERPLVLAAHLVPSLPIGLFEVLIEAIEYVTGRAVVLLHEPRSDRPVAKQVADIAILPASEEWKSGKLLPASFVFQHRLNRHGTSHVYADIVVATDRAPHVEDILDLRGHRCALPDRRKQVGVATLLFEHLRARGESPAFFGNTLDADSQVAALQMVAGKQAEIGILEAPVIRCHKNTLPGVESLCILTSLGPLPPYRIMVNETLSDALVETITKFLLNVDQDKEWMERFTPFGIIGFAKNCTDFYNLDDMKPVVTSVPYY